MSVCCSVPLRRPVVTRFGVADDDFGEEGGRAMARMLELNSSITDLCLPSNLIFCRVSCGGACDYVCALLHVTNVLADNKIGPEGARAISSGLERNSTLNKLNVNCESALAAMKVAAMICGRVIARAC
jgi:hypothetical protein